MSSYKSSKALLLKIMIIFIIGAGIILAFQYFRANLLIEDPRTGDQYYNLAVKPGDNFTLTCRNSVSKSLVKGTFMITLNGRIDPLTTVFTSYGPGLPFDFMEEYQIKDGLITIFHNEESREELRLWVTPQTEETITINNRDYPLGSLTETNLLLNISVTR
jgi:hypothetical protein